MAKGQAPTKHSDKVGEQLTVAVTTDSNVCIKE